jgi:hypothetical protein
MHWTALPVKVKELPALHFAELDVTELQKLAKGMMRQRARMRLMMVKVIRDPAAILE